MTTPSEARCLVNAQSEDDALWFEATTASEAYLQSALRELHAPVERDTGGETGPLSVAADDTLSDMKLANNIVDDMADGDTALREAVYLLVLPLVRSEKMAVDIAWMVWRAVVDAPAVVGRAAHEKGTA